MYHHHGGLSRVANSYVASYTHFELAFCLQYSFFANERTVEYVMIVSTAVATTVMKAMIPKSTTENIVCLNTIVCS